MCSPFRHWSDMITLPLKARERAGTVKVEREARQAQTRSIKFLKVHLFKARLLCASTFEQYTVKPQAEILSESIAVSKRVLTEAETSQPFLINSIEWHSEKRRKIGLFAQIVGRIEI